MEDFDGNETLLSDNCNARIINLTQAVMCDLSNQFKFIRSGLDFECCELAVSWYQYTSVVDIRIGL